MRGVSAEGWELPSLTSGGVLRACTKDRGHPSYNDLAGELKNAYIYSASRDVMIVEKDTEFRIIVCTFTVAKVY